MSDNKLKTSKQDRDRVDLNDSSEVEYLHGQYPSLTHQQVKDAIKTYGPMRVDIVNHLNGVKGKN